jgi:hypothetical protein
MSTLSQFAGGAPTTSIVNAYSSGGVQSGITVLGSVGNNATEVVPSGELTANVLATALSVTGGGEVPFLTVGTKDTTSRTVRAKVTVDGVVVFDATSSAVTILGSGMAVVGYNGGAGIYVQAPAPIRFNSSLLVEIASSRTETGKVSISYVLNKR